MPRKPTEPQKMENLLLKAWAQSHSTQKHWVEKCMEWSVKGIHPLILKSLLERQEHLGYSLGVWETGENNFCNLRLPCRCHCEILPLVLLAPEGTPYWQSCLSRSPLGFTAKKYDCCTCQLTAAATIRPWSQSEGQLHPPTLHSNSHSPTQHEESKNTKNCKRLLWTIIYQQIG